MVLVIENFRHILLVIAYLTIKDSLWFFNSILFLFGYIWNHWKLFTQNLVVNSIHSNLLESFKWEFGYIFSSLVNLIWEFNCLKLFFIWIVLNYLVAFSSIIKILEELQKWIFIRYCSFYYFIEFKSDNCHFRWHTLIVQITVILVWWLYYLIMTV